MILSTLRRAVIMGLFAGPVFLTQPALANEEAQAWETVSQSTATAEVYAFIEKYPNGTFIKQAKAYMIDLLWSELNAPEKAPVEQTASLVSASLTFTTPLTEGTADIIGKTFEDLIKGKPLFPPIEGLPEQVWKSKDCSSCHEWQQANLCEQAHTYASDVGSENLTKKHPYGGSFKLNLRTWAAHGCN